METDTLEQAVKLARFLWYVDYRKWDMDIVRTVRDHPDLSARQVIDKEGNLIDMDDMKPGEGYYPIAEDVQSMLRRMPIDWFAKAIENSYGPQDGFDRYYFYDAEAWFAAEKVIDAEGATKMEDQLETLCEGLGTTREDIEEKAGPEAENGDPQPLPYLPQMDELFPI